MSDSLGRDRLIEKFKGIAKEMSGQLQQLQTLAAQTEDKAANEAERIKADRLQIELIDQLVNNSLELRRQKEVQLEGNIQGAEDAITIQINAAKAENQAKNISDNYNTIAILIMALLNDAYLLGRIVQDNELLNQMLEMAGYNRVKAWLDAGEDTKDLNDVD